MTVQLITITSTRSRPDGSPEEGEVTFQLSESIIAGGVQYDPVQITGTYQAGVLLANDGTALQLLPNNAPGTLPNDSTYLVTVRIADGAPTAVPYSIVVPYDAAGYTATLESLSQ